MAHDISAGTEAPTPTDSHEDDRADIHADTETIVSVLGLQTWAVVGLSGDPSRTAYQIAAYLAAQGKHIVPVHPDAPTVLGEQGFASLSEIPFPVDVVDVFRRSEAAGAFADEAVRIGAKAVWFQLGVVDTAARDRTVAAGLQMVMDTCPHIEGPRLLGWPA